MNRSLVTMLTGAVVVSCLAAAPTRAGIDIQIFPPAWYIATARPVYYEGHASYWYGDRWHYRDRDRGRDGWRWRTYDDEPRYLREYRAHREPERHHYEHWYERHRYERERDREGDRR